MPDRHRLRSAAGEGAVRLRAGDAVCDQPAASLVATKRDAGLAREPSVDRASAESVSAETELEYGDVPAHRPDPELPLSQERVAASTERPPCRPTDQPRRSNAVLPL